MISQKIFLAITFAASIVYSQKSIESIDMLLKGQRPRVFAKLNNGQYIKVQNDNWPDSLDESINVFYSEGKVRLVAIMPFSQSHDWYYEVDNYFDDDGELIAYVEIKNHYNSICLEEAIHRTKVFLKEGNKFSLFKSTIQDSKGNDVSRLKCEDPYDFTPELILHLKQFLKTLGLSTK